LLQAFRRLRKAASPGVDGVTYAEYEGEAERNIIELHRRLKSQQYRAQPLRRVYIPKGNGQQRPISIPSLEDKIVQRATATLLEAIYEQDFLECPYGFRYLHHVLDEWFEQQVGRGAERHSERNVPGSLPVLWSADELPQSLGVPPGRPADLEEVAQPANARQDPELDEVRPASPSPPACSTSDHTHLGRDGESRLRNPLREIRTWGL